MRPWNDSHPATHTYTCACERAMADAEDTAYRPAAAAAAPARLPLTELAGRQPEVIASQPASGVEDGDQCGRLDGVSSAPPARQKQENKGSFFSKYLNAGQQIAASPAVARAAPPEDTTFISRKICWARPRWGKAAVILRPVPPALRWQPHSIGHCTARAHNFCKPHLVMTRPSNRPTVLRRWAGIAIPAAIVHMCWWSYMINHLYEFELFGVTPSDGAPPTLPGFACTHSAVPSEAPNRVTG